VAGCKGQLGVPLVNALCKEFGSGNVIASDISDKAIDVNCEYRHLDVTNREEYERLVKDNKVTYIVHLAAILSALGEQKPDLAIDVNVQGFLNAINIARDYKTQIYVPSSIAVYGGPHFNRELAPVDSILQPTTVYGISKVFNEQLGEYYFKKFGVDFRSLRYPGIISSEKYDFNGTTDYSTGNVIFHTAEIIFEALEKGKYECFLREDTFLPMMYIDDCIKATVWKPSPDSYCIGPIFEG